MKDLLSVALVILLAAIGGGRLWAWRSLRLLSVEQKALVLEASSKGNFWLPLCLAFLAAIFPWLPGASIPSHYRPGVFASYLMVPFLLSVAASIITLVRLARLSLPRPYLRSVGFAPLSFTLHFCSCSVPTFTMPLSTLGIGSSRTKRLTTGCRSRRIRRSRRQAGWLPNW